MGSNNHRETFGIVVRVFGFLATFYGLYRACHAIARLIGLQTISNISGRSAAALAIFFLVIGLLVLRRADWIVRFSYGSSHNPAN